MAIMARMVGNTVGGLEGDLGCSAARIFARRQLVRHLTAQSRRIADLARWFVEARGAPAALAFNVRQTPNGGGEVELSSFFGVWRIYLFRGQTRRQTENLTPQRTLLSITVSLRSDYLYYFLILQVLRPRVAARVGGKFNGGVSHSVVRHAARLRGAGPPTPPHYLARARAAQWQPTVQPQLNAFEVL